MNDSVSPASVQQYNEIDLIELVQSIWKNKFLIALAAIVGGLCGGGYAFFSSPVYEAKVSFLPPSLSDIASLSAGRNEMGLTPFTVDDVYSVFTRNLESDDSLRKFFESVYLPSLSQSERDGVSRGKLYRRFMKEFRVVAPDRLHPDRYSLMAEGKDPSQLARWITVYVDQVASRSLEQAAENARREVDVVANNLQQQIASMRATAKNRRQDRIVQLKEALRVSEAVGLSNPPVFSGQTSDQLTAVMEGNLMYMRGSKALRAELNALESRVSDDAFIPGLRTLEEKHELYASIRAAELEVGVFRQDGDVLIPDEPIRPKKSLIIFLGVAFGGLLGGLFAVVRAVQKRRASYA